MEKPFLSSYEEKTKRYKIIMFILTVFMIAVFFIFATHVHGLIKRETPYVLESCEWVLDENGELALVPGSVESERDALAQAKKILGDGNFSVSGEYEKCAGWVVEKIEHNAIVGKILVCRNGYLYRYSLRCKRRGIVESLLDFFKMVMK